MSVAYSWGITKDLQTSKLPGEKSLVGLRGPRGVQMTVEEMKAHEKCQRFRMKDDDGEVYVEGVLVDLSGDASGFEPLDDYGMGGLGCTSIEYWEKGWKAL